MNELKILIGMHRNVNEIDKETAKIARKHGLTLSQFAVLEALYNKKILSVGEIRELILSSAGTVPLIINNLEKGKLVVRDIDKKDKRITNVSLTKKGFEIIEKAAKDNYQMIVSKFNILSEAEKNEMLKILKKIGGR